jgi:hypothetical protein
MDMHGEHFCKTCAMADFMVVTKQYMKDNGWKPYQASDYIRAALAMNYTREQAVKLYSWTRDYL